jgi:adenosine deaminase
MHKKFQKAAAHYRVEVRYMIGANWARPIDVIERLARFVADCADIGVVSFGFSGEEPTGGLERYERACAIIRNVGLLIVPHLGETGGPANVRAALDLLGAQRIAHGIGAAQDHELLRHLADRAVVCDVCPSSNVRLGIVPSLDQHPVRTMLDSGVAVTINADDPLFFRTSASKEILKGAWSRPGLGQGVYQGFEK